MSKIIAEGCPCKDCFREDSLMLGLDSKKNRPFTRCWRCGTTTFYTTDMGMSALSHVWEVPLTIDDARKRGASGTMLTVKRPSEVQK